MGDSKSSKLRKIFQIVIPKSCPQCGKRALKKRKGQIICGNCNAVIKTELENNFWFFSSQEKSVLLDLKKELIEKQRKVRDRLFEINNMRKML